MSEETIQPASDSGSSAGKWILLGAGLVYVAVSLYFLVAKGEVNTNDPLNIPA